jgi:hypothetical protein
MVRFRSMPQRRYTYSQSFATSTDGFSIEVPVEIKDAIDTVDSYIPMDVFGVPTEYILMGAGLTMLLLPMGKFKGIASMGGFASLALGGLKFANQFLVAAGEVPVSGTSSITYTQPWDHPYYSELRQPV